MPRRKKLDTSNQLAFDFNAAVAQDVRDEVKSNLIPNTLVTPAGHGSREAALRFFEKWEIPLQSQARMMGFWHLKTYEAWVDSDRDVSDKESDYISVLSQIDEFLGDIFGSREDAMTWLNETNKHFDNLSPLEYMSTRRSKVLLHVSMRLWLMKRGINS